MSECTHGIDDGAAAKLLVHDFRLFQFCDQVKLDKTKTKSKIQSIVLQDHQPGK